MSRRTKGQNVGFSSFQHILECNSQLVFKLGARTDVIRLLVVIQPKVIFELGGEPRLLGHVAPASTRYVCISYIAVVSEDSGQFLRHQLGVDGLGGLDGCSDMSINLVPMDHGEEPECMPFGAGIIPITYDVKNSAIPLRCIDCG